MAELVGHAECPECKQKAGVYADKRGQLYLNCKEGEKGGCGIFKYQSKTGQARLKKRMESFLETPTDGVESRPIDEAGNIEESPKINIVEKPKKKGFFQRRREARRVVV